MTTVMLVAEDHTRFDRLQSSLESLGGTIRRATSGREALAAAAGAPIDLVVADETLGDMPGVALARQLVAANPMINCAVVSRLAPEAFHEATEGLGILMQLPPVPETVDAERLMARLDRIRGFAAAPSRA